MSDRISGFNTKMFKSHRSVRRAFLNLGYAVNERIDKPSIEVIQQFQNDFNKCSDRIGRWEKVDISQALDLDTLNALERAVQWAKSVENTSGTPSARAWQSLCSDHGASCPSDPGRTFSKIEDPPPENGTNFVEVLTSGFGKLRNIYTDDTLRCNILRFERHENIVFAVVEVPPQGDLPSGRSDPISCPCIFAR